MSPRHPLTCPCSGAYSYAIRGPQDSMLSTIHDLVRSYVPCWLPIVRTRAVVYLSPGLCLTILTTIHSLSRRTVVWLNPTHPLRQMSVCSHTPWKSQKHVHGIFLFYLQPLPSHPVRLLFQGLFVFVHVFTKYAQGMKLHQYGVTSCHARRK